MRAGKERDRHMRIVMIGDTRYHLPFIDLIPFDEKQNAALGKEIEEAGEVLVPIIANKAKSTKADIWVTDGAHRCIHAAHFGLNAPPAKYRTFKTEDDEKDFVRRVNLHRRHLTPEQLEEEREKRIARIVELRQQGESLRAIAEAEGVSKSQVERDLEASTVPGGTVEPKGGKVTGKDGRTRTATPATKGKAAAQAQAEADKQSAEVDCFKTPVPEKLKAVFFDPWIQNAIDVLGEVSAKVRESRIGEEMHKKGSKYPFFDPKDFKDGYGFVIDYLDQLIGHLKDNRPAAVCPKCGGKKCPDCRNSGMVPRTVYAQLTK